MLTSHLGPPFFRLHLVVPSSPFSNAQADEHALPQIETVYTETMGKDAVMVCKIKA